VSNQFPNFKELVGNGSLKQTVPVDGVSKIKASVELVSDSTIGDKENCQGILLRTENEVIVALLSCKSGAVFLCPAGIENCEGENWSETTIKNGLWERRGHLTNNKYTVEFSPKRIVYRILEKNCLIPYRHGCLLHGLGWHDLFVFDFSKD